MNFVFTRAYTVLVFILIKVTADFAPQDPFEGQVYLADRNDKSGHFGTLKVYTQGEWNLVCYHMNGEVVMNTAAAAAACRQLGYPTVLDGKLQPSDCEGLKCTPLKAISGIRCPEVADYSSTGEIFLLRCDNQEETASIKLIVMTLLKWNAILTDQVPTMAKFKY